MLSFRVLDDAGDAVVRAFAETEQAVITDMARRIAEACKITDMAAYQANRLAYIGAVKENVTKELARALKLAEAEAAAILDEAAARALEADNTILVQAGYEPIPLAQNEPLQRIIRAGLRKTLGVYFNLTKTTANTATKQFEQALDLAYHEIITGAMSYQQALTAGIRVLTEHGLATGSTYRNVGITYPTTWFDYMDVAFRRAALTGTNQSVAEVQLENISQLGLDLVETTAHASARPEHAEWQGKVFSVSGKHPKYPSLITETGYGTGPGLCGWNCRHSFFPFVDGGNRAYPDDELHAMNARRVKFNGKEMTLYDATQYQRYNERQIRKWKREESAFETAGLTDKAQHAAGKVLEWQAKQRDFISQTGLRRDYFRERAGKQHTGGKLFTTKNATSDTKNVILDKIKSGEYSTKLSHQQYLRHVEGTKEFEEYVQLQTDRGKSLPSKLFLNEKEAQEFVNEYSGTGVFDYNKKGTLNPHEYVTSDKIIGEYQEKGVYYPTHRVQIKYGKRSSHLVPVKELKKW